MTLHAAGADGIEHASFMTADGVDAPESLISAIAQRRTAIGWTVGREPGKHDILMPMIASRLAGMIAIRRRLYWSGALLAPGSDAGVSLAKPHDVLRFAPCDLVQVGLSPAEVLWAMTSRAAQVCGLGHRKGRVAVGFDAVDGNPLEDLAAIRRFRAVYAGGVAVTPAPDVQASAEVP